MRSPNSSLLSAAVLGACLASTPALADAPPPDETPPEVSIVMPKDGATVPAGTSSIAVQVKAVEEESGVTWVKLEVDGKSVAKLEQGPWLFKDVSLEPGEHTLIALARNYDGEDGTSAPVKLTWADTVKIEDAKAIAPDANPEANATAAQSDQKVVDPQTADKKNEKKKGCSVSASGPSWGGAGIAFGLAIVAGFMLRRRA